MLIEKETLLSKFDPDGRNLNPIEVRALIVQASTVDAIPVVHAHCVDRGNDCFCSNCGEPDVSHGQKYCPDCGAVLDGKDGEKK